MFFTMRMSLPFRVWYTLLSAIFIVTVTVFVIRFAQGYRVTPQGPSTTGLFAANSFPPGAEVLINGRLTTATDSTINLPPGTYDVEIRREGYLPWKKTLTIQQGLVTQSNAQLYRRVPSLTPLTFFGAHNVTPSPETQKLL
jgi:hypothetical protein